MGKVDEYKLSSKTIEQKLADVELMAIIALEEVGCLQVELFKSKGENELLKKSTETLLAKAALKAMLTGRKTESLLRT